MILESVFNLFLGSVKVAFGWIQLPAMPSAIENVLEIIYNAVVSGASLIGLFCHMSLLTVMIPLVIIVINFSHIWHLTMFILKKIPFVGIE